jgi:hypothetical protein
MLPNDGHHCWLYRGGAALTRGLELRRRLPAAGAVCVRAKLTWLSNQERASHTFISAPEKSET